MNKEERKNEFVKARIANMAFPRHMEDDFTETCKDCFDAGAEWKEKKSPWISVKDRLPPLGKKVIHTDINTGRFHVGQVNEVGLFVLGYTELGEVIATHWMLIPSFDEILEANKDILERIKENGD